MIPLHLWIQFSVELPLVLFHVTVFICILNEIRHRNAKFATGFFAMYTLQSVADLSSYVIVSALAPFKSVTVESIVLLRPFLFGIEE